MKLNFVLFVITISLGITQILPAMTIEQGIIDTSLNKTWELVKTNRPADALQRLSQYRPDSETKIYYHFIYGRTFERMQKPLEALEHYRSAYFYAPSEELKELTFLERAEAYLRIKNYYEAKIVYDLFMKKFNKSKELARVNLGMAQSLDGIGLLPEALQYYEKAGEDPAVIFGKANVLHRLGRLPEAHEFFLKGISKDKVYFLSSGEILFYYGENLQQMGNDQEAVQYLTTKIEDPVFKRKADLVLGRIALKGRKLDEAQKYFNSALLSPDRRTKQEALFHLAETHQESGKKAQAKQEFQDYRLKYPAGKEYEDVLIKLSKLDMEEGRFEQTVGWIKELGLRFPLKENSLTELEKFFLQLREKDPPRMVSLWKSIGHRLFNISREPFLLVMAEALKENPKLFNELQQWLAKNGSEKVKIQSSIALVHYYVDTGNLGSAMEGIRSLKTQKVSGDEILRLESRILHAKMDYGTASERLLALKKMDTKDLSLLGDTLTSARDINKALVAFEKNLLRLGGNSDAYIKLADGLYEKQKKKEALQYYQKALENDPLNEWALYRAGSLMAGVEAQKMLGRIKNENSLLGKFAKSSLKEIEIQKKLGESF